MYRVQGNVWRFGDAEFNEASGKLAIAGEATDLDRQCAAVLGELLRNAGRDVPKERLLDAGWPDRIVHENSLAKAIVRLRRALGPYGPALYTAYGRGYRLEVEPHLLPAPEGESDEAGEISGRRRKRPKQPAILAALSVLVVLAAVIVWSVRPSGEQEFRTTPPVIGDAPDAIGRLLWVDDHPQNNIYEERFFENRRIAVHTVTNSADALRLLAMYDYTVVVSDMGRGEDRLAGLRLAEQMRAGGDQTPLVIYTVRADGAAAQQEQRNLVAEAGAHGLAVTPQEVRSVVLRLFGNPPERKTS